jgi:hypothetical protein
VEDNNVGKQDEKDIRAHGQHGDAQPRESVETHIRAGQAGHVLLKTVGTGKCPSVSIGAIRV